MIREDVAQDYEQHVENLRRDNSRVLRVAAASVQQCGLMKRRRQNAIDKTSFVLAKGLIRREAFIAAADALFVDIAYARANR
ncbi:uncharacterized protein SCHCODRAFT_011488 [Schizophyllum commune H4-8]|uniref:Expressed protein n=1 Tax=Schizophyllum commune (strain H4-8 / FGSC 9210) TaxID=578458 RepID=D8Q694_SCHCM|nr:uncharacterized protein SCHCODRAFT_011488 [Schizophyllum commune H4-8]KAI5891048.1 hypothetical protein SCHCODRAFT_011488 [Schizophyllum commune H4-8]